MFGMKRVFGTGWRRQSKTGWFYIGLAGDLYTFHLEIGRFSLCLLAKEEIRKDRYARMLDAKAKAKSGVQ